MIMHVLVAQGCCQADIGFGLGHVVLWLTWSASQDCLVGEGWFERWGLFSVVSGGRYVVGVCDAVGVAETRCISSLLMHLSLSLSLFASAASC